MHYRCNSSGNHFFHHYWLLLGYNDNESHRLTTKGTNKLQDIWIESKCTFKTYTPSSHGEASTFNFLSDFFFHSYLRQLASILYDTAEGTNCLSIPFRRTCVFMDRPPFRFSKRFRSIDCFSIFMGLTRIELDTVSFIIEQNTSQFAYCPLHAILQHPLRGSVC